jgi:hypothetical protein
VARKKNTRAEMAKKTRAITMKVYYEKGVKE